LCNEIPAGLVGRLQINMTVKLKVSRMCEDKKAGRFFFQVVDLEKIAQENLKIKVTIIKIYFYRK